MLFDKIVTETLIKSKDIVFIEFIFSTISNDEHLKKLLLEVLECMEFLYKGVFEVRALIQTSETFIREGSVVHVVRANVENNNKDYTASWVIKTFKEHFSVLCREVATREGNDKYLSGITKPSLLWTKLPYTVKIHDKEYITKHYRQSELDDLIDF